MTNKGNRVLYTGVTGNLFKRVSEHKNRIVVGFTSSYNVTKLVYYEEYNTMEEAIAREKQIKGGSRQKKLNLINSKNHEWKTYMRISLLNQPHTYPSLRGPCTYARNIFHIVNEIAPSKKTPFSQGRKREVTNQGGVT